MNEAAALKELFALDLMLAPLAAGIEKSSGFDRCKAIRAFYKAAAPAIDRSPSHVWAIDPYTVDWVRLFTPIEMGFWHDIRCEGAVLYPQYPIGRFFADFANLGARVAIECDGRKWHQDAERDKARQREIEALGWRVYRIEGWQCLAPDEIENEDPYEDDPQPNPDRSGLVLREICRSHCISSRYVREGRE